MDKQTSSTIAHYAKKMMQPFIGLSGILKQALITSKRNAKPLSLITIITLSFYTAMDFSNVFIFLPMVNDFMSEVKLLPYRSVPIMDADPGTKQAFLTDFRHFLTWCFAYLGYLSLLFIFAVTATAHSSSEAYTGKVLSLQKMLSGMNGRFRRALKTSICMGLISFSIGSLFFFGWVMMSTFFSEGFCLDWGFGITAVFGAVYLFSLWMVAVVVSVVEEGFSGMKAIGEAGELMKGKKFQGFSLTGVMVSVTWGLTMGFGLLERGIHYILKDEKLDVVVNLAVEFPQNIVFCVLMMFGFVAFTVYYHECKQRKMEKETRDLYAPIAVAEF